MFKKPVIRAFKDAGVKVGGLNADIVVKDERFYRRVALFHSLGLGHSYMDGDFFCEDVREVLYPFVKHRQELKLADPSRFRSHLPHSLPEAWIKFQLLFRDAQSIAASASSIKYHYDQDPVKFYQRILGASMTYSCAYFSNPDDHLDTAQMHKNRHISGKLDVRPGMHALEIGCGWGTSGAVMCELNPGVTFHCITISKSQFDFAMNRHKHLVDAGRLKFYLMDYREIPTFFGGKFFDAVYSIGMFEHVGPEHYDELFEIIWRSVKWHRPVVIHSIFGNGGIDPFTWYEAFPGGILPTEAQVMKAATRYFTFLHGENFGPFYSKTLRAWRGNLLSARQDLLDLGYPERLIRKYDFAYAAWDAGFEVGRTQLLQLTLAVGGIPGGYKWGLRNYGA